MRTLIVYVKNFLSKEYENDIVFKIKTTVLYIAALLIIFAFFRLLFCLVYLETFAPLTFADKAKSFLFGLRFDIHIISVFLGPFIGLMFIPQPAKQKIIIKFSVFSMSVFSLLILFLLLGDFFYFPEVRRHMSEELVMAFMEKELIAGYALSNYWHIIILSLIAAFGAVKFSFKIINRHFAEGKTAQKCSYKKSILMFLLFGILLFLGIRASFGDRPVNTNTVYLDISSFEGAQLALNGVFTQEQFFANIDRSAALNSFPSDLALKNVKSLLLGENEIFIDGDYPIMRALKNPKKSANYNVVVILIESLTPHYIDGLNNTSQGGGDFKATPNLDAVIENSIVFTNAFSAGLGSLFGISAALTGVPLLPSMVFSANSINTDTQKTAIAEEFNKRGYKTFFIQADNRESMNMTAIAKNMLGFSESYGLEDIPMILKYIEKSPTGYDFEMFDFAAKKAAQSSKEGKPFFMFLFTGSMHVPFYRTAENFEIYPPDTLENKYLNNLFYTDSSLRHFIDEAKKGGFFDDTIFIITADHTQGYTYNMTEVLERFRIPFIVYAPKIFTPRKISRIASQTSLMPTLYHLLGFDGSFSAAGVNLFDENARHFALMNDGQNIIFAETAKELKVKSELSNLLAQPTPRSKVGNALANNSQELKIEEKGGIEKAKMDSVLRRNDAEGDSDNALILSEKSPPPPKRLKTLLFEADFVRHNRQKVIDSSLSETDEKYKEMEVLLLSLDKIITETFKKNIWFKKK